MRGYDKPRLMGVASHRSFPDGITKPRMLLSVGHVGGLGDVLFLESGRHINIFMNDSMILIYGIFYEHYL